MEKLMMYFNQILSLFFGYFSALFFSVSWILTRLTSVAQTGRLLTICGLYYSSSRSREPGLLSVFIKGSEIHAD